MAKWIADLIKKGGSVETREKRRSELAQVNETKAKQKQNAYYD
jgi:hypothetical protein